MKKLILSLLLPFSLLAADSTVTGPTAYLSANADSVTLNMLGVTNGQWVIKSRVLSRTTNSVVETPVAGQWYSTSWFGPMDAYKQSYILARNPITIAVSGNATKIRFSINSGSGNVKAALYDAGGNRIALSAPTAVSGPGEAVVTISSTAITPGDYTIAVINEAPTIAWGGILGSIGTYSTTVNYAAGPPATLPASEGEDFLLACGLWIE